jgi:hypothetical protein
MAGGIRTGIATYRCATCGLRSNHSAVGVVIPARASSGPDSDNPWLLLVGAEAAGPIWIGDSGRCAVHVPRGHVGDTPSQKRQRRRQGTRMEKSE